MKKNYEIYGNHQVVDCRYHIIEKWGVLLFPNCYRSSYTLSPLSSNAYRRDLLSSLLVLTVILLTVYTVLRRLDISNSDRIDSFGKYQESVSGGSTIWVVSLLFIDGTRYVDSNHTYTTLIWTFSETTLCTTVFVGYHERRKRSTYFLSATSCDGQDIVDNRRETVGRTGREWTLCTRISVL